MASTDQSSRVRDQARPLWQKLSVLSARHVSGSAVYYMAVGLLMCLFFGLWRLLFVYLLWDVLSTVPREEILKSFFIGWRFDFAVMRWPLPIMYLLSIIPFVSADRNRWTREIAYGVLTGIVALFFLMHLADIEFFRQFNGRLNGVALLWQEAPGVALSMIWRHYPVIWYLLLLCLMTVVFMVIVRKLQTRLLVRKAAGPWWIHLIYLPLVTVFFFPGGRIRLIPEASVDMRRAYFSDHDFANQLALNPVYTFVDDVILHGDDHSHLERLVRAVSDSNSESTVRALLDLDPPLPGKEQRRIRRRVCFEPQSDSPPNVLLIIMESFGNTRIGALDNQYPYDLSPEFDSLASQGILFTNMYSTGQHTHSGIFSTLFGYPHLADKTLLKRPRGYYQLWGLPSILKSHGYETLFFVTHDRNYDNLLSFLNAHDVDQVFGRSSFYEDQVIGPWGVPDHVMFDFALKTIERAKQPFFATLLTTSNHMSFDIPDVDFEHIPATEDLAKELNAFKYSDWALGRFLRQITSDSDFDNTLIVITSDNGSSYQVSSDLDLSWHTIPLLILSPNGFIGQNIIVDRLGSQADIMATIMGIVRRNYDDFGFGHDLLDPESSGLDYAHLAEWNRMGYIESDYLVTWHENTADLALYHLSDLENNLSDSLGELTQAHARKMKAVFEIAYRNSLRPLRLSTADSGSE